MLVGKQIGFMTLIFPILFCLLEQIGHNPNCNFYRTQTNPVSEVYKHLPCHLLCSPHPCTHRKGSKGNVCFCQGFAQLSQCWSPHAQDFPLCLQPPWQPWTSSWKQVFARCSVRQMCSMDMRPWAEKWHQRHFISFLQSSEGACGLFHEFVE